MTIRMDSDLKAQFDALCNEFGMSTNCAYRGPQTQDPFPDRGSGKG